MYACEGIRQALLACCAAQFSIYPLELIRTRLAVCPPGTYRGISDCFARIVREEGWLAFYRGLTPSLVRLYLLAQRERRSACARAPWLNS
jgi:hypothetical protein